MATEASADSGTSSQDATTAQPPQGSISQRVIRHHYGNMPIGVYKLKDEIIKTTSQASFRDSILIAIAFISATTAFGFYPTVLSIILVIALFAITIFNPFLGVFALFLSIFPIFMYQTPVLAWTFLVIAAMMFMLAYKHYRSILFMFVLVLPAFSVIGYFFEIPLFIFMALTVGAKRAIAVALLSVILIVTLSGVTGMQNDAYIVYNAQQAHTAFIGTQFGILDSGNLPGFDTSNFIAGLSSAASTFTGGAVTSQVPGSFDNAFTALSSDPASYLIQAIILAGIVFGIEGFAIASRSRYKGALASMIGIGYPLSYVILSYSSISSAIFYVAPFLSFLIAPVAFFLLEDTGINLVKALEVRKSDIRQRFGEAFEDLEAGSVSQTFAQIGNYEATKEELREAVISPIEERGVARAYNINPTKGILFFGPPGTGKTMMMRALANEIHGGFFYVKASNIISAFPGETEKIIEKVFGVARKNSPCILFFDEIDAIALNRETGGADETHRQALSQLLTEMDGFQKVTGVIIVGATNRPDLIDRALLRPGRFDKLVYMPLPDANGREAILNIYLSKLPVSKSINIKKLVQKTDRFSGADLKTMCDGVAQTVAQEAIKEHKVLEITEDDLLKATATVKPSTSLAQLDEYKKFKLDFERSLFKNAAEDKAGDVKIADILGDEDAKKAIKEAIETPLLYPELMKKYNTKPISGVLFFGPPGTGKTMLMHAVMNEKKGITVVELSGAAVLEQGIDQALAQLKETFNRARENTPCVLYIDEIDGLFPDRENASEFGVQLTAQALKELDSTRSVPNIVVVGTTNRPDALDKAILRPGRFDRLVFVGPPNQETREQMFKSFLKDAPCSNDIDCQALAAMTNDFTGAEIAGICDVAKRQALESEVESGKSGTIDMNMLKEIISTKKPAVTKQDMRRYTDFVDKYGSR